MRDCCVSGVIRTGSLAGLKGEKSASRSHPSGVTRQFSALRETQLGVRVVASLNIPKHEAQKADCDAIGIDEVLPHLMSPWQTPLAWQSARACSNCRPFYRQTERGHKQVDFVTSTGACLRHSREERSRNSRKMVSAKKSGCDALRSRGVEGFQRGGVGTWNVSHFFSQSERNGRVTMRSWSVRCTYCLLTEAACKHTHDPSESDASQRRRTRQPHKFVVNCY